MFCKNCQSKDIKKRKNHSHGVSSGATTSYFCKECGSSSIEIPQTNFRKRRR